MGKNWDKKVFLQVRKVEFVPFSLGQLVEFGQHFVFEGLFFSKIIIFILLNVQFSGLFLSKYLKICSKIRNFIPFKK